MAQEQKMISVVTPCFNEESNVLECYEKLKEVFSNHLPGYNYEHIFCDNASKDGTLKILKSIAEQDSRVKVISNSRNFGAFNSMFNGMLAASGNAVIPFLPADLQDPPELIPEFVRLWEQGYEVVYGVRSDREESNVMHGLRRLYYKLVNRFANIDIPLNVGEFTLIDKKVHDALRLYEDYYPYLRGMIASCGFRSTMVPYTWKARRHGITTCNHYSLIDNALNGIISFTNIPMRLCMFAGLFLAILSIGYAAVAFTATLFGFKGSAAPGVPTLIVALFFFSGIQLFFLGVLGEYISAIHFQVRKRPLVIERERINF